MATPNDTDEASYGGRGRGAVFADGRSVEPPKPTVDMVADWGNPRDLGSREPNDRALDLVDAAGSGGFEIHTVRGPGYAQLALVDTTGATPPEYLRNVEGQPLTYENEAAAEADIGRLCEVAAERQREMENENDCGMSL